MRRATLSDFLTDKQIAEAAKLKTARHICDQIIQPNIEKINRKLGQECDPMYLSYAVEYALSQGVTR